MRRFVKNCLVSTRFAEVMLHRIDEIGRPLRTIAGRNESSNYHTHLRMKYPNIGQIKQCRSPEGPLRRSPLPPIQILKIANI
jgi:hypothetical protein